MGRLFHVFALFLVLVACLAILGTSMPLDDDFNSSGDVAAKPVSPTGPDTEQTSLSRVPRGIGLGYYNYGYMPYYPRPTLLGYLLYAKRRFLGTLGGLFRPRPWGYYGYY